MNMKRLLLITIIACVSIITSFAQTDTTTVANEKPSLVSQNDSLRLRALQELEYKLENLLQPRYKLYPTENMYILLKLDTATGKVWMVQYRMGDTKSMVLPVDDTSLLVPFVDVLVNGRFELYPTKNMYNFILLDKEWGSTYQVQWSTDSNKRFRESIY